MNTEPHGSAGVAGVTGSSYAVPGPVGFKNLTTVRTEGEAFIHLHRGGSVDFDMSAAKGSGSPAVAAMMAWYRCGRLNETSIGFVGLPMDLRNIIEVSGLDEVLRVRSAPSGGSPS